MVLNVSETSGLEKMREEKDGVHRGREEEKIWKNKNAAAATANARVVCDTPTTPKKSNKKKKTDDDAPAAFLLRPLKSN